MRRSDLPSDWDTAPLEAIVLPKTGLKRGPFGGALKKSYFVESGYKVYQQGNVIRRDWSLGDYYIDGERFAQLQAFEVLPGDFLVSCSGTIGRIVRAPEDIDSGVINQALLRVRINFEVMHPEFFRYQFESDRMQRTIIDNTHGGAMQNLVPMTVFRGVKFPLPPLPEQRVIAEILGTWDEAIALVERRIAAARQRKKALMQQLLTGKRRFKEFEGEAWREVRLGEVAVRITDGTHRTPTYVERGIPFISTNNLVPFSDEFDFSGYRKFITPAEHVELTKRCRPERGDLLISKCGTIGRTQLIRTKLDFSIFVGLALMKLDTSTVFPAFLEQLLNTDIYRDRMEIAAPGGTRATLTISGLSRLQVRMPMSLTEQLRITETLRTCDEEIDLLTRKLAARQRQKRGLMQRLLTGRVRVTAMLEADLERIIPFHRELAKRHWIPDTDSVPERIAAICDFLEITSPEEQPSLQMAARQTRTREPLTMAQIAWGKRVERLAAQESVPVFDREALATAILDLLTHAARAEDAAQVPGFLKRHGVHFVVVPHLSQTYLDGALLYRDQNPIVGLTLRYDRLDSFWFTLMHELAHLILGHAGIFLDSLDERDDISTEEREANRQAEDWLIDSQAYGQLRGKMYLTHEDIEEFAREHRRHPSIVAGRLRYTTGHYERYRRFDVDVRQYLEEWVDQV